MLPHSIESRPYSLVYTGDPHCHLPRTSGERGSGASRTVSTAAAVRPTEVAPTLLENLNISVASFHEKLINAEKLQ